MMNCQKHIPKTVQQILILCHGYGADGLDLTYGMEKLYHDIPQLACFYPNAPQATPFGGYEWFSLDDFTPQKLTDISYLDTLMKRANPSVRALQNLTLELTTKFQIPPANIFLGGFSQGALIALMAALSLEEKIAGILSLSGVPILFQNTFPIKQVKQHVPILMTHGEEDTVIPEKAWYFGQEQLKSAHQQVSAFSIPELAHGIDNKVLDHMITFIKTH